MRCRGSYTPKTATGSCGSGGGWHTQWQRMRAGVSATWAGAGQRTRPPACWLPHMGTAHRRRPMNVTTNDTAAPGHRRCQHSRTASAGARDTPPTSWSRQARAAVCSATHRRRTPPTNDRSAAGPIIRTGTIYLGAISGLSDDLGVHRRHHLPRADYTLETCCNPRINAGAPRVLARKHSTRDDERDDERSSKNPIINTVL